MPGLDPLFPSLPPEVVGPRLDHLALGAFPPGTAPVTCVQRGQERSRGDMNVCLLPSSLASHTIKRSSFAAAVPPPSTLSPLCFSSDCNSHSENLLNFVSHFGFAVRASLFTDPLDELMHLSSFHRSQLTLQAALGPILCTTHRRPHLPILLLPPLPLALEAL